MQNHKAAEGKPARPQAGGEAAESSSTLYFGNLHPYVNQKSLEDLCSYFGAIENTKVIKDKGTGTSAGYGFVKFKDRKAADAALQALNGKVYMAHELRVNWAFQSHQKEDTSHHFHIFVGDLGQEVTDAMLYNAFCKAGSCSDARVMWDHSTGRSKGYGFVSFRTKEDAAVAIEKMHGSYVGSRRVRCGWAQHKQDETAPPPSYASVDKEDPQNTNVYVGNISADWGEAEVTQHFSVFGKVQEVKLHKKGGYGFVRFSTHAEAVKAIVEMHRHKVDGKVLKCSWGKNTGTAASGSGGNSSSSYSGQQAANMSHPMMMAAMQPMMSAGAGLMAHPSMLGMGNPMMLQAQGQVLPMSLASQMMLMSGQPASPTGMSQLAHMGARSPHQLTMGMDPHTAMYYGGGMYYS